MRRYIFLAFILLAFAFSIAIAEEFNWSWEGKGKLPEDRQQMADDSGKLPTQADDGPQTSPLRSGSSEGRAEVSNQESVVSEQSPDVPAKKEEPKLEATGGSFSWSWGDEGQTTPLRSGSSVGQAEVRGQRTEDSGEGQPPTSRPQESLPADATALQAGRDSGVPGMKAEVSGPVDNTPTLQDSTVPTLQSKKDDQPALTEAKPTAGSAREPAARVGQGRQKAAPGAENAAYAELLKDNLELRRKIAETTGGEQAIKAENEKLSRQIKELEQKITQSVVMIQNLKKEKTSSVQNIDKVIELETRLSDAEGRKAKFSKELEALIQEAKVSTPAARQVEPAPASPGTGSDLFRQVEKENAVLRNKLVEIDTERQKAQKAKDEILKKSEEAQKELERFSGKQKELEQKLADVKTSESQQKKLTEKLMKQLPALEKELSDLRSFKSEKNGVLGEKEEEIETLKSELLRREQRLIKAERMAAMLEDARGKVGEENNQQMRDMHYNLGSVYSREGKFMEAKTEYLRALRIDPADPDIHYNLGILYDENLGDKQKAAMHYRRYLTLNPNGSDVDKVKSWLMGIEMK